MTTMTLEDSMKKKGWVTPAEAVLLTGIPLQTLYTWIRRKTLASTRVGARRLFISKKKLKELAGPAFVGE
jgi:excisionase family DNA binding protein